MDSMYLPGVKGRAADVIYLNFSKGFNLFSHGIFIFRFRHYGLGGEATT